MPKSKKKKNLKKSSSQIQFEDMIRKLKNGELNHIDLYVHPLSNLEYLVSLLEGEEDVDVDKDDDDQKKEEQQSSAQDDDEQQGTKTTGNCGSKDWRESLTSIAMKSLCEDSYKGQHRQRLDELQSRIYQIIRQSSSLLPNLTTLYIHFFDTHVTSIGNILSSSEHLKSNIQNLQIFCDNFDRKVHGYNGSCPELMKSVCSISNLKSLTLRPCTLIASTPCHTTLPNTLEFLDLSNCNNGPLFDNKYNRGLVLSGDYIKMLDTIIRRPPKKLLLSCTNLSTLHLQILGIACAQRVVEYLEDQQLSPSLQKITMEVSENPGKREEITILLCRSIKRNQSIREFVINSILDSERCPKLKDEIIEIFKTNHKLERFHVFRDCDPSTQQLINGYLQRNNAYNSNNNNNKRQREVEHDEDEQEMMKPRARTATTT